MMLAHPQIDALLHTAAEKVPSIVVEHPDFFFQLLQDVHEQMQGLEGKTVLSDGGRILSFSSYAELIDSYVGFSLNRKPLLTKILSALEKQAVGEHYQQTMELLTELEGFVDALAFPFSCQLSCTKLHIGAVLKALGIELADEGESPLERLLNYMELVREFDRDKLFLLVNLRSYFPEHEISLFLQTVLGHGYHVILLDSQAHSRLPEERRVTIDRDLCEF